MILVQNPYLEDVLQFTIVIYEKVPNGGFAAESLIKNVGLAFGLAGIVFPVAGPKAGYLGRLQISITLPAPPLTYFSG